MASKTTCDGCGVTIEGEAIKRGFVHQCEYCEDCAVVQANYQGAVDALHARLAQSWYDGLAQIRAEYLRHLARLPDTAEVGRD